MKRLATTLTLTLVTTAFLAIAASSALAAPSPDNVAVHDPATGQWIFRDAEGTTNTIFFGDPGLQPLTGDWDGDGGDDLGVFDTANATVYLRFSLTQGVAEWSYAFGNPGDLAIAGDWDGDGIDTIALVREEGGTRTAYFANRHGPDGGALGAAATTTAVSLFGDQVLAGDWTASGIDTLAAYDSSTATAQALSKATFTYGNPGDAAFSGDWDGNPIDTLGVFRDDTIYLRNANSTGVGDVSFTLGAAGMTPLAWNPGPTQGAWFVDNRAPGPGTGTLTDPFSTLAAAEAASGISDTIFVFEGDGTDAGLNTGITLKDRQTLVGEASGLTIDGSLVVAPGGRPKLSASGGANVVTLAKDNTVTGLALNITGAGAAIEASGLNGTVKVTDVDITANSDGISIENSAGIFDFTGVDITSGGERGLAVIGNSAWVRLASSTITQTGSSAAVAVIGGHTGRVAIDSLSSVTATNGIGLHFNDADGVYVFDGQMTLNGGDAGIDIINGSDGLFTFANTDVTSPTNEAIRIGPGGADVTFGPGSSATQAIEGGLLFVEKHAGVITFDPGTELTATSGYGVSLVEAHGSYSFDGGVNLDGSGGVAFFSADGTFTFDDLTVVDSRSNDIGIFSGAATVTVNAGVLTHTKPLASLNIAGHTGSLTLGPAVTTTVTNGNGFQFSVADGVYHLMGPVTLNGDDAGIDITNGSAGTFTFDSLEVTNPLGDAFVVSGGPSQVTVAAGSLTQSNAFSTVDVNDGHTGTVTFDAGTTITATNGIGLQFDNADGTYDFDGQATANGTTRGITIQNGSDGTFAFNNTDITSPIGDAIAIVGGTADVVFGPNSSVTQNVGCGGLCGAFAAVGGHSGTFTMDPAATMVVNDGRAIGFLEGNGTYVFAGSIVTTGGPLLDPSSGVILVEDSVGTITFADIDVTSAGAPSLRVRGGSSSVSFAAPSSIVNADTTPTVDVADFGGTPHTGTVTFDAGTTITATNGRGLQFDNADGTYDFTGPVTLNGGDAGIDILSGSDGTFTFADTDIASPTQEAVLVRGGTAAITFGSGSSLTQANDAPVLAVFDDHSGSITLPLGATVDATNGPGLVFDFADGTYHFMGTVTLNGGDAGIDLFGGSDGTLTFDDISITDPTPNAAIDINGGGTADLTIGTGSVVTQSNNAFLMAVSNGHTGVFTLEAGASMTATNGTGLQLNNADGTYLFEGTTTLNGGDAGIDIVNGSGGTFSFGADTTITNPTGPAVRIQNFAAPGDFDYAGSVISNLDVILSADTTAPGSTVDFTTTGGNSLTSTDNPSGAIFLFDIDGDLTITTPTTVVRPGFSAMFATDGDGVWTFHDFTVTDQKGLNGGVDVFGQMGTVNFHNVNITTDSAGTGDATTGFLAGGNNIINVTGSSTVDADGGGALVLINVNTIDMTFQSLTSTNNLNTQIGFAGDDGIDLLNVGTGTLNVTGTTTVKTADGVGISVEDSGATVTFADVDIDGIGLDGVIAGVAFDNPGTLNINGGAIANTGNEGLRFGAGVNGIAAAAVNNVTFTGIGGFVAEVANSGLSGAGNVAVPFSCNDLGGNTGSILFNGGADSCP